MMLDVFNSGVSHICVTHASNDYGLSPLPEAIMGTQLHLFRRGNVFYWRRRIPGFSTENCMIQLSLRTGIRRDAGKLARKLTAESDRMYDDMSRNLVTVPEARAFLSHVITDELARMRRVSFVTRMDPVGSSESDRRADWATAQAWKLMAEHGPRSEISGTARAKLLDEGASERDLASLENYLELYTRDVLSEVRMNRIKALFREAVSQETNLGAGELLYLRRLLIEGKAAAQAQLDTAALDIESEIAVSIAEELAGQLAASTRGAWLGVNPDTRSREEPHRIQVQVPTPTIDATQEAELYDPSLMATVARLNEAKMLQQRKETGKKQVPETMAKLRLVTARQFILITKVTDVRQIRQAHVSKFRDMLQKQPKSWGKGPNDAAMTWDQVMDRASTLPADQIGLAVSTINRHLDVISQILTRAEDDGIAVDPKLNVKKLRLRDKVRSRDKRTAFSETDLNNLFRHSIWTGSKSGRFRNKPGKLVIKDGLYWVPLIAAYTGARREEIAGLQPSDIKEEEGVPYFDIVENDNRGVKTLAGERRIPIHDRLIAVGLLDYVEAMQRRRSHDLFPELRPSGHFKDCGKRFGDALYTPFAKALEHVFSHNAPNYVQHSFRHYVNNRLSRETAIPKAVRIELMGHEGDDTNERVYIEPSPILALKAAVDTLPVIDDLLPR